MHTTPTTTADAAHAAHAAHAVHVAHVAHARDAQGSDVRPTTEEQTSTRPQLGFPWNVIVWDDPVNLMSYVVYVFQKLFGFNEQKATRHMLEVHNEGRSRVASVDRERGEFYVSRLHAYGLQATLERSEAS